MKRQKTDHTPDSSVPTTPATEPRVYPTRADIKAALQAESAFEALARAKRAELGFGHNEYETEWVLNGTVPGVNGQNIHSVDSASDSEEEEDVTGRQTYGGYKRRKANTTTTYGTPGSKLHTPVQSYKFDDFDSDSEAGSDEDGEIDSDSDGDRRTPGSSSRKRKANVIDEDDELAMSALDRTDLSKTGYAKAKKATPSGKRGGQNGDQNQNQKKKWQNRGARGKKLGRKSLG